LATPKKQIVNGVKEEGLTISRMEIIRDVVLAVMGSDEGLQ